VANYQDNPRMGSVADRTACKRLYPDLPYWPGDEGEEIDLADDGSLSDPEDYLPPDEEKWFEDLVKHQKQLII
jgi:hypothetical protein